LGQRAKSRRISPGSVVIYWKTPTPRSFLTKVRTDFQVAPAFISGGDRVSNPITAVFVFQGYVRLA